MARQPRYLVSGHPQHVIQRGNNRQPIFKSADDYWYYYECLKEASRKTGCDIHAYVLMENHVHMLVTPHSEEGIGRMMQSVGRRYVQYFNGEHNRSGTLWEGRYRATLVDALNYLLPSTHYIETNAVRSGLVRHPREYAWSSYGWHAHGTEDELIVDHAVMLALGATPAARRAAYRRFIRKPLDEGTIESIRNTMLTGWVLGTPQYLQQIAKIAGRRTQPLPRGRRARKAGSTTRKSGSSRNVDLS